MPLDLASVLYLRACVMSSVSTFCAYSRHRLDLLSFGDLTLLTQIIVFS